MRYIISGKNIDVTEGLKSAIYEKIGKLEKFFTPETEVHVTLSVEKVYQILKDAKGNYVSQLVNKPVEVTIDKNCFG